jgi:hypothetical protein
MDEIEQNEAGETSSAGERKPISEARLRANRANAKLSSGPRSAEGKAISCLNNYKHGRRTRTLVLPWESREEYEERLATWSAEVGVETDVERRFVTSAVNASWRLDRFDDWESAEIERASAAQDESFDERRAAEARRYAGQLLAAAMPPVPKRLPQAVLQKAEADRLKDRRPREEPDLMAALTGLRSSSHGITWLIQRWEEIAERVQTWGWLEPSHRYLGLALQGLKRSDLRHPHVNDWTVAYLGALYDGNPTEPDVVRRLVEPDGVETFHPSELKRFHEWLANEIPNRQTAREFFLERARTEIAELRERLELIELREERDRQLALRAAQHDSGKSGAEALRFLATQDRLMRTGVKEARALRAARLGEGGQPAPRPHLPRAARASETASDPGVAPATVPAVAPAAAAEAEATADVENATSEPTCQNATSAPGVENTTSEAKPVEAQVAGVEGNELPHAVSTAHWEPVKTELPATPASLSPPRALNPRPTGAQPGETWDAYRPRDS